MGRGKIEIKKIENSMNRQVTYSKRRTGIMKKAKELTVLCDAEVSLIMFSSTRKLSEFISPSTSVKKIFDRYQQVTGKQLWQHHYEKMQETLNKLKDVNNNLRREIRQRKGDDDLDDLNIQELRDLEQNMEKSVKAVRDRKFHVICTQTDTSKKKIKNHQETHKFLLSELDQIEQASHFESSSFGLANRSSHEFAFGLQPSTPNLQDGRGYGSYDFHLD